MHKQLRVLILILAYNAEKTIESVLDRIPRELAQQYDVHVLVLDDGSRDATHALAKKHLEGFWCPGEALRNPVNQGYGGNQKVGYRYAAEQGFDVVAMVHGDGQYAPECLPMLLEPFARQNERVDAVFGSRMLHKRDALKGGMPYYKFVGNMLLTAFQNRLLGTHLSEFHTGYRVYRVAMLRELPLDLNTNDFDFDTEIIMNLAPEVILISPFKEGGYDVMKEVGIPLLPHLGYKETTPLGQAEWLKLVGLLTGEPDKAMQIFAQIEQRYNTLKALTANVAERPIVLSGEIHGGNWYAVGGKSFLAEIFKDAGADYVFKDDPRSGGIYLDFETVYNQADKPRYWRILNNYPGKYTYEVLKAQDERYADFKAFRERGVIYCNMRERAYYENMPMEPDLLLADFIKVFHPSLLPDYEPVYYRLLKE